MEDSKSLQKCGEILIDIKSRNKKNRIYFFQCTFCDIKCDQLKKFSLHIAEEHLNDFDEILKEAESLEQTETPKGTEYLQETELKFEVGTEQIKLPSFNDIEITPDIKVFDSPLETNKTTANTDPLDTVNAATSSSTDKDVSCEIKYEIIEQDDDEAPQDMGVMDGTVSISDSDKSDSDEDYVEEVPHKKRKATSKNPKKGKQKKRKENPNESDSDESKDAECNAKKEKNAIKKHKRCKRRWQNIDDTKLPIIIEMYKKNEVLWQVSDIAFGVAPKKIEIFNKILEELKTNNNFDMKLNEFQHHIEYLNYIYGKEKQQQLKCEVDKTEFKPTTHLYKELSFLSESQGPFKCTQCEAVLNKYEGYRIHLAQHNDTIPFPCKLCEMKFQRATNFYSHVERHLGIYSYHCDVCGKGYPTKTELDWHVTAHTGAKPFLCATCGASFRTRHNYDNHIRRHEKRFRYECNICKKGFNHPSRFRSHIKTHLNIRDVLCTVCGKGFTAATYMERHKLIHQKEKRYKCPVCGKAFAQDAGLRAHRKIHQPRN